MPNDVPQIGSYENLLQLDNGLESSMMYQNFQDLDISFTDIIGGNSGSLTQHSQQMYDTSASYSMQHLVSILIVTWFIGLSSFNHVQQKCTLAMKIPGHKIAVCFMTV
jgi:hypothetical protein